jgi:hypothetical protein
VLDPIDLTAQPDRGGEHGDRGEEREHEHQPAPGEVVHQLPQLSRPAILASLPPARGPTYW